MAVLPRWGHVTSEDKPGSRGVTGAFDTRSDRIGPDQMSRPMPGPPSWPRMSSWPPGMPTPDWHPTMHRFWERGYLGDW
jgi:hypothetical protein